MQQQMPYVPSLPIAQPQLQAWQQQAPMLPCSMAVSLQPLQPTIIVAPPQLPVAYQHPTHQPAYLQALQPAQGAMSQSCAVQAPASKLQAQVPERDLGAFFAACCRLLGYKHRSTVHLALHCWGRLLATGPQLRQVLAKWTLPPLKHSSLQHLRSYKAGSGAGGMRPGDAERATALVLLWAVAKCEEERKALAGAHRAATLLPASCVHGGAARVCEVEIAVMELLDWSPYRGLPAQQQPQSVQIEEVPL